MKKPSFEFFYSLRERGDTFLIRKPARCGIPLPSLLFVVKSHKRFPRFKVSGAVPYIRGPFIKATRNATRSPEFIGFLFQFGQSIRFSKFDTSAFMVTRILKPLSGNSIHKAPGQEAFF